MENSGQSKSTDVPPHDLLRLIRHSGVLSDRQFEEVRGKVRSGEYPRDSVALAGRLIEERILTKFQADRLLRNKAHGLVVGRYVILDRLGAGGRGRVFRAQHRLMPNGRTKGDRPPNRDAGEFDSQVSSGNAAHRPA